MGGLRRGRPQKYRQSIQATRFEYKPGTTSRDGHGYRKEHTVSDQEQAQDEKQVLDCLQSSMSRRQLLKAVTMGAALAVVPVSVGAQDSTGGGSATLSFPFFPPVAGTYTPENIQDILNILVTMERFGVAINVANLTGAIDPQINPVQIDSQQASLVQNLAHVRFLTSLGARALTDTFTTGPAATFTAASLKRAEVILTIYIGAYMAAAREFAELGQPLLVKWAFQSGARYAGERVLARGVMALQNVPDTDPPNNKAFETDLFVYVRDAYALLTTMGLFGGLPRRLEYPSDEAALTLAGPIGTKVLQKVPNNASVSITSPADVTKERL